MNTTMKRASSQPGYHGQYLRVDLSTGQAERVGLEPDVLRRYLGGSGLGTYLLLREESAKADPFAADAALAFVFSPLVGSPLTTSAKFAVVSKGALTGRINDALASSHFAIAGKMSGCDAIVLRGQADRPSVLVIDDRRVWLEPAGDLWGLATDRAGQRLRDALGADYQFALIGPAGERRVRYATLSHDCRHAGRGGSGAVLGAKNIKAVAVRGRQKCTWAHPEELVALARRISERSMGAATAKYRELGTASNLLAFNRLHALPTRNFQQASFARAAALAPEHLTATHAKTRRSCAACTIGCQHMYALGDSDRGNPGGVRLEYENLFALGPLCGVGDPDMVLRASRRCDQLGLDTISTGGTIAFAMECAERGLLAQPWLRFGAGAALHRAIELIGARDGLGDQLAEGSRRLAEQIGHDSIRFAPQVKGLEIPGYEPRTLQTMALGFAVGTRGADHNRSGAYEADFSGAVDRRHAGPEAAWHAIQSEDRAALIDSLILCKFLRGIFDDLYAESAEMLRLATGWDVTAGELRTTAGRIVSAKKQFNILCGWQPEEDTLPDRFLQDQLPEESRARLPAGRLAELVASYNRQRGWTPEGWIGAETLQALDLGGATGGRSGDDPVGL